MSSLIIDYDNFEEGFDVMNAVNKALVRNYIKPRLVSHTIKQIREFRKKHKNKTINVFDVKVVRTNGENYAIYIRYSPYTWIKEYSKKLILWSDERIQPYKENCITTFHFVFEEYH